MKKIKFYYRVKKYGTWQTAEIHTSIPDLTISELKEIARREVDEAIREISLSNPKKV